jgi:hypothetical protein
VITKRLMIGTAKSVTVWLGFAIAIWPIVEPDVAPVLVGIFGDKFGGMLISILGLAVIFNRYRTTVPVEEKAPPAVHENTPKPAPMPDDPRPIMSDVALVPVRPVDPVSPAQMLLAWLKSKNLPQNQIAYIMATAEWETGRTFRPVRERRAREGTKLRATQDRYWHTGYYGRGHVQITWERNYLKLGQRLGLGDALVKNPDAALREDISQRILLVGMLEGLFTGKKLSDYVNAQKTDYVGARAVVNGTDKAQEIAALARKWAQKA